MDLLNNEFGEFTAATPAQPASSAFALPGQTSTVPAFSMPHSTTLPSLTGGIRPGFPPQVSGFPAQTQSAVSGVNALNMGMMGMPQSQSMTFAPNPSGAHWNIPSQPVVRPGANAPNYSSATMGYQYGAPTQTAQVRKLRRV